MTSPIPSGYYESVTGAADRTSWATSQSTSRTAGNNQLGQDAFLKLLIAQLRYQDPTSPADSTSFLAQTAQFTQVEKLAELVADQRHLLYGQLMLNASSLIGRTVSYLGPNDELLTGVVTAASFVGGTPMLRIGEDEVPLFDVIEVRSTPSTTPSDPAETSGGLAA
ncbi:MAG: flagellar hook capping protein [Actinobacteria bacterium]|nr:MAG: flagellar hook capping protein [Actinomycetota bacterium]